VDESETVAPAVLIWAVGRSRAHRAPPAHLRPGLVLDLNYADDSPGLEYAATHGLAYQSGLGMFKLQAQAQRDFWDAREGSRAGKSIR
jgi:shikimate 5-dehydrogenase